MQFQTMAIIVIYITFSGILSYSGSCPKGVNSSELKKFEMNSIFTKVRSYLRWIDRNTADSQFCSRPNRNRIRLTHA